MTTITSLPMVKLFVLLFALCLIKDAFPAPVKREGRCSIPMDIAILLDSSGSTGRRNWPKMINFAVKLMDSFDVSEEGTHFAVLIFSSNPEIKIKFNTYNGTELNRAKIKRDIKRLRLQRGYPFIDKALIAADKEIFTVEAGMRQEKRKVAIVVTDGIQTKDKGTHIPLVTASNGLKTKGVDVYALGVGLDIDVMELLDIASNEDYVLSARGISTAFPEFIEQFCKIK